VSLEKARAIARHEAGLIFKATGEVLSSNEIEAIAQSLLDV
jgi:hypothetical protein